ncbi:hypothetical protein MMH89_02815 [Candidatus Comchoanobacter bicostacola]|uniref:Uncharacterized protein n=1 Tax=Candidatus Comchoanobacter bicostacola TaxID=2919598 RepID=A0ABY5DIQ5_9GAMM|nr:hypothetical protein [Candidatus Comchoanobacter bicostacola]UTC24155.1 hypothetical protein MMH89_02815 [Candidatus Comchoanobacter bicostacola]
MKKLLWVLLFSTTLNFANNHLSKWAEFRIAEMFHHPQESSLQSFFTSDAWNLYQTKFLDTIISPVTEGTQVTVTLQKFISPVKITPSQNGQYVQSTFLIKCSDDIGSWETPVEMILNVVSDNGNYQIESFEGISQSPINVKHFQQDRQAACNN